MAQEVLEDAFVEVNGNDISDTIRSVSVPQEMAQLAAGVMGDDTDVQEPGLKSWTVGLNIRNDFASGQVDSILSALYSARTKFTVKVRVRKADAIGVSNPEWSGTGFISSYGGLNGQHGALVESDCEIAAAGTLTRATA